MAGRARLPKVVRRWVQKWLRVFVFTGLTYVTLWTMALTVYEYSR